VAFSDISRIYTTKWSEIALRHFRAIHRALLLPLSVNVAGSIQRGATVGTRKRRGEILLSYSKENQNSSLNKYTRLSTLYAHLPTLLNVL
jgi:hypothetical protein